MPDQPRHSVSVAGIVTNESGEVLVIRRRDNGEWQPPGGILEIDETIEDGLRREIFEETGIETILVSLAGVYQNMGLGVIALVFRCRHIEGTARRSDETSDARWMSPTEAEQCMTPAFAIRVRDALNTQTSGVTLRSHSGDGQI